MNKLVKGAVAGAAGIALLLGGAGTFALWNSTATVNVGTVNSGTLSIAASGSPSWKNISSDAPAGGTAIAAIANYKIVPGDKLELTQTVNVNATGDNLKATLSYDDATITGDLKSLVNVTMSADGGASVSRVGTTQTFLVTPGASATTPVTVKVTVELPSTVAGTTGQGQSLNLSALAFKLQQNAR